ncbi:glycogen debranching protein GlgX [Shewanella benthica]|uniref:Glycogen operon protein n=1 Tax=Shewanella benthica KT99 TaxID=314608 RepID=A9D2H9_9GAMM|nr:glycogen debranching protein GlgX [Shewanella benthica]EDQ01813.1 glycogen operon protein [Shewanella benthica KT99]
MKLTNGKPYPLGASVDDCGVNFALFSAHGTRVTLCIFDEHGHDEIGRFILPGKSQHIWHGYLQGAREGLLYGYRVDGLFQPLSGHRFNANKLLLDPYAKQLVGECRDNPCHYSYILEDSEQDLSFDTTDNAASMPKCRVVDYHQLGPVIPVKKNDNQEDVSLSRRRSIIYELHVKGFTQLHPDIVKHQRGTFAGLASPESISYLINLGITCVELMPVQSFFDEPFLQHKQLSNYWGYNSIGFFAPHQGYLSGDDVFEFRHMVTKFHKAGIEVILDVVYNHTAEGNRLGPTYSFRGIDNLSYYRLSPSEPRYYINDTGCGNTLNITHPNVLQLVMDSLRYWVEVMGVDGFRFDLATCMGRETHGFDTGSGFFDALAQDPVLSQTRLIAEPWDIGPGGYQLGQFPMGWSEWNDRYRDTIRRFWRGDAGILPEFARRFHGSSDLFEHSGRPPAASINFVTSHDGFSLMDLVSYSLRHNQANGEDNRDGHQENFSHNYGVEGVTDDPDINGLRARQCRNILTTLFLSQGVPMLLAGDEVGHSQSGNNNAYCQDSPLSWREWQQDIGSNALLQFTRKLIHLRKRFPLLCHHQYIHEGANVDAPGLDWFCRQGGVMTKALWSETQTRSLSLVITGELEAQNGCRQALLLMLNTDEKSLDFCLPELDNLSPWRCLLHTQDSELNPEYVSLSTNLNPIYHLQDRSLMLFYAEFKEPVHEC